MFNAECSAMGPPGNFLGIDIVVDPAGPAPSFVVPPTDSDNALCSGNNTAGTDGWVSAVSVGVTTLPLDTLHIVSVRARTTTLGVSGGLDDLSLVVFR
jgi:hypothetical protein